MSWETLISQFLSQPITQFGTVIGVFLGLHKMGILDVRLMARSILGIEPVGQEHPPLGETVNLIHAQMSELAQYYNHDTTARYTDIQELLRSLKEGQAQTNEILRAMKEYGIKVLKQ